jgi:ATP-dependent phosphoenolpyruvate carboxykinase
MYIPRFRGIIIKSVVTSYVEAFLFVVEDACSTLQLAYTSSSFCKLSAVQVLFGSSVFIKPKNPYWPRINTQFFSFRIPSPILKNSFRDTLVLETAILLVRAKYLKVL